MLLEHLVVNLTSALQRKILHGREHVVAPMTLIVPGVLNGSNGPLYYPPEEISANVSAWNHIPIVVYHPSQNGKAVSARTADVLNTQSVGILLNARVEEGKLKAEGWFDIDAMERVDNRVLKALLGNTPIELSTGLELEQEPKVGDFNGIAYNAIARNYRPDHLAVLPDQPGACSLKDGCGVLVNKANEIPSEEISMAKEKLIQSLIANCDCWTEDDKEVLNAMSEDKLKALNAHVKTHGDLLQFAKQVNNGLDDDKVKVTVNQEGALSYELKEVKEDPPQDPKEPNVTKNQSPEPPKPMTDEEWLSSAPPKIRSVVQNAMNLEQQQKDAAVQKIVANERNTFSAEYLQSRSVEELNGIVALLPEDKPTVNYFGAATPAAPQRPVHVEEPLEVMSMADLDSN